MEIKTGKNAEPDSAAVEVPPDRGRQAHKKAPQKAQRTRNLGARLFRVCKILATVSLIALIILGAFAAYRFAYVTDLLALRHITIDGCRHADAVKLEALVRGNFQGNLLRLRLDGLRSQLESEAWIRRAEIRRVLPDTLKIRVEERVPAVIAEIGGELQLLDKDGILLDRYGPEYGKMDVPVFSGLKGDSAETYQIYQGQNSARVKIGVQVVEELAAGPAELTRAISEIDLSDESNIKIVLVDDTASVYLGDHDFLKRFQTFMTNLSDYQGLKAEGREFDSVDLRFDGQIVYHGKAAQPPPPAKPNGVVRNQ